MQKYKLLNRGHPEIWKEWGWCVKGSKSYILAQLTYSVHISFYF